MGNLRDLTGSRFERLVVVERASVRTGGNVVWTTQCDCGNRKDVRGNHLTGGLVRSCGCLQKECIGAVNRSHGLSDHRTHAIWMAMIRRCSKPSDKAWKDYGGRGIKVAERWAYDFGAFVVDMGLAPAGMSIERKDNSGNYEPGNCRWATSKEQARNRRSNRVVQWQGRSMTVAELAENAVVSEKTLRYRLKKDWPVDRAVTEARGAYWLARK